MDAPDPRTELVEENMLGFARRMLAEGPDWLVDRSTPQVWAVSSDVPSPIFNQAVAVRPDRHPRQAVRDAVHAVAEGFCSRRLPWMWLTSPSHTSPDIEDALTALGLTREDEPAMWVDLDDVVHPEVPWETGGSESGGREVVEMASPDGDVLETFITGFGMPEVVRGPMSETLAVLGPDDQVLVAAREGGRTVGVGTGFISEQTIGVYNVATLPEHRGQGVGSAVTVAILEAGRDRGCRFATLQSSALGRRVYERLGFREVGRMSGWVWVPSQS